MFSMICSSQTFAKDGGGRFPYHQVTKIRKLIMHYVMAISSLHSAARRRQRPRAAHLKARGYVKINVRSHELVIIKCDLFHWRTVLDGGVSRPTAPLILVPGPWCPRGGGRSSCESRPRRVMGAFHVSCTRCCEYCPVNRTSTRATKRGGGGQRFLEGGSRNR